MAKSIIKTANTSKYLVTAESDIVELIEDNLEGDELTAFDLRQVVNPQGKAGVYTIPGPAGDDTVQTVEGVVVFHKNKRAYWPSKYKGGSERPTCSSLDAKTGKGEPGGSCKACALSQFGTKLDDEGNLGRGQACQLRKHLFLVREGDLFPLFFSLPPTAAPRIKEYLAGLISYRLRYHQVVTKITLEKEFNKEGTEFYAPRFEMVGELDDEARDSVASYRDQVIPWLQVIEIDNNDFDTPEPDLS